MAAEAPRSTASPDSYIGSLISLISKSEIRYEGILYKINTEESSIGLRNVQSFGTEGRKMDGQQVHASDKIYEFILFRGSDIKDLQVKASPPAQTTPMQNDPAIIQSNYPHPSTASPSLPANMPSFGSISAPELNSYTAQFLPTYQTGGSFGTWSATPPPPSRNVSGLAAPMHWQGYHAHSQGLSHLQEPPLIRPPPGLATPPMQQTLQYQGTNALLYSGSSNYPEFPRLFPPVSSNLNLASTSLPSTVSAIEVTSLISEMSPFLVTNKFPKTSLSAQIPSVMLPPLSSLAPSIETSASLTLEISPFSVSNNVPKTSLPAQLPSVMLPPLSSLASSVETSSSLLQNIPSVSSKPGTGPFSSVANQTEIRSILPVVGSSPPIVGSSGSKQLESSVTLVTPYQLMQPTPSVHPSAQSLIKVPNEVEIKPLEDRTKALLSERPAMKSEAKTKLKSVPKEPILPLPSSAYQKPNGALLHATQTRGGYGSGSGSGRGRGRGRGRGSGYTRPVAKFSEEFDFTAMNEKFNKDKVWGDLGRSEAHSSDREQEEETDQFDEDNPESLKFRITPVYVKDEFFDTLSCKSNDQASNGRIKYSEQLKIDTETFGNFQLNNLTYGGRGLRGGGGGGDGGRGRSSYSGRSYEYSVRGRGYKGNNGAS